MTLRQVLFSIFWIFVFNNHLNAQWIPTNGPMGGYIRDLISDGENVYATTGGGGVLVSEDNGLNWDFKNNGILSYDVKSFALSENTLFVSCDENVYRSLNQGESWEPAGTEMEDKYTKTLLAFDNMVFAGTYLFGVYRSMDDGLSWIPVNNGLPAKYIYWLETDGENIYAGTYQDGMYKSSDYGQSWVSVNNGLGELNIMSIYSFEGKIFASTLTSGVFVSEDSGENWAATAFNLPSVKGFTSTGGSLFAASFGTGVYRSNDTGLTWQLFNTGLSEVNIWAIDANGTDLYVGVTSGHIFKSSNSGSSWELCNSGIFWKASIGNITSYGNRVFAGSHGCGFYSSDNAGDNWTKSSSIWTVEICSVLANESIVLAGTDMLGIFKSTNNGNSFSMSNTGLSSSWIQAFTYVGNNIFAGSRDEGLFISINNASNWSPVNESLFSDNIQALSSNIPYVIAGTADFGVFVSNDLGMNWSQANNGLPDENITALHYVNGLLLAGTKNNGVYASENNGNLWYSLNNGISPFSNIRCISSHDSKIFISTGLGKIFVSYDLGLSWEEIASTQSQTPVFSLWPCQDDEYLYVGLNVNAVYKRPLDEFVSIDNSNVSKSIQVYPNPTNDFLFIEKMNMKDKGRLTIYNMNGEEVQSKTTHFDQKTRIDMSEFSNGIYFLKIETGGIEHFQKVIKQ